MISPTINDQIRYRVPNHEVLLSFNSDKDAENFVDWWRSIGWKIFEAFDNE